MFDSSPPALPQTNQVFDSDLGPTDELAGVMQVYFTEEEVETDEATGGQALVYKPRWGGGRLQAWGFWGRGE